MPSFLRVLAVFVLTSAAAACVRPTMTVDEHRDALQLRERGFLASLEAKDTEGTAAYFADDAVLQVADRAPIAGRAAIQTFYGNVFRFLSASVAETEAQHVAVGGDLAYSLGRVSNTFQGAEGPVHFIGKYLVVWEKRGQDWFIVAYSVSSDEAEER